MVIDEHVKMAASALYARWQMRAIPEVFRCTAGYFGTVNVFTNARVALSRICRMLAPVPLDASMEICWPTEANDFGVMAETVPNSAYLINLPASWPVRLVLNRSFPPQRE